ncbi:F-box/kelch-repeat protein SKIP20-like [Mangifera indica]|uniref:F-box/kelch-repeat protein SKIP20-like n=1 Tax=Mangifera indica TaxID=29780 RepID=UPI001CFB57B2|nr:F-box/kelch-repeat protein SKIP20-like [Mangifera indica]
MTQLADRNLIPGLPDEIAMECLIRVPYKFHSNMKSVCHTWQNLLSSLSFYQERIKSGTAEQLVCQIQPLPSPCPHLEGEAEEEDSTLVVSEFPRIGNIKKEDEDQQQQDHRHQQQQQVQEINNSPLQYGLSVYNCDNQTWQRIRPKFGSGNSKTWGIPMFCQCVTLQSRGKLLLLGGWDPATLEPVPNVYVLDMVKGPSWRRAAPMLVARSFFACAVVGGSKVYVAGGHDNQKNALKSAEVYDVEADEWRMLPEMEEERDECQGMSWDGDDRFWVVSGYGTESQGRFRADAECYNPATGIWSKVAGVWPFPSISPRGTTTPIASNNSSTKGKQCHCLWFLSKEQLILQQQRHGEVNLIAKEYEEEERKWKMVSSIVGLPNTITGTSPCVSVTRLGDFAKGNNKCEQRMFVMTGNGSRGTSSSSAEATCSECEGEGAFIMERDNKNGNTKWTHVHMPAGFSGFPYSASHILI